MLLALLARRGRAGAGGDRPGRGRGAVRHAPAASSGPGAGRGLGVRAIAVSSGRPLQPRSGNAVLGCAGPARGQRRRQLGRAHGRRLRCHRCDHLVAAGPKARQVGALFKPARSQRSSSTRPLEFSFRVTRPSTGVDLRTVTARARVVRKLRFPGRSAQARQVAFDLRPGDGDDFAGGGGCRPICGSRRIPGVSVERSGGGLRRRGRAAADKRPSAGHGGPPHFPALRSGRGAAAGRAPHRSPARGRTL